MEKWATRPPRIAAHALAACIGGFVWLLLSAGSASADEGSRPAGGLGELRSVAADLRSAPSPLGQRGSAAPQDRSDHGGPDSPSVERTVAAVGDAVVPVERETSRTVDRVVDAVPAGDRAVDAATDQVDRTTDAAVAPVTTLARTVDATVTEPVVRPVLQRALGAGPSPRPEPPSVTPRDRVDRAEVRTALSREPGRLETRSAASRSEEPVPSVPPLSHDLVRPGAGPGTSDADSVGRPAAVPEDGQPGTGEAAGVTGSADGGGGALAVLDGCRSDLPDHASDHSSRGRDTPRGPTFGPAFSPG